MLPLVLSFLASLPSSRSEYIICRDTNDGERPRISYKKPFSASLNVWFQLDLLKLFIIRQHRDRAAPLRARLDL